MKLIALFLLVLSQNLFAQNTLDDTGFGEIRLGQSYESLEDRLAITDVRGVPEYAWFAPMSLDYWLNDVGQDTTSYYEMLETDRLVAESLNLKIVWCTFSKKKEANFFGCPIVCAQLIFEKNALKGIILVFNKDELTEGSKESIFEQFESAFGEVIEEDSTVNPPRKFDATWKINGRMIRVSDALSMDGEVGETVQVLYWQE